MDEAERQEKERELAELRGRVSRLEQELGESPAAKKWEPQGYFWYYATTGSMLGMIAAFSSLLVNVVFAPVFDKHPLELIRVYLTFPLGEGALSVENGLALTIGCCLYIATGMIYGILFQVVLAYTSDAPGAVGRRLAVATGLALAIWLVNFYGILTWLQPTFFGGNWIVEQIPFWVAALTHLVFGWTMALLYPWGRFNAMGRRKDSETAKQEAKTEPA